MKTLSQHLNENLKPNKVRDESILNLNRIFPKSKIAFEKFHTFVGESKLWSVHNNENIIIHDILHKKIKNEHPIEEYDIKNDSLHLISIYKVNNEYIMRCRGMYRDFFVIQSNTNLI